MNSSTNTKVYILCRYAAGHPLYQPWLDRLPLEFEIVKDDVTDWIPPTDCGIVVSHEHFQWETVHALRRIHEQRIYPTLMLADGILEYRNTWDNPSIAGGSMYQPLFADKIACIGSKSARMIESWGNAGRTEIVGLPRLDQRVQQFCQTSDSQPIDPTKFNLLVVTATTPAFTDQQRRTVAKSLQALKSHCDRMNRVHNRDIQIRWRLTENLDQEIGITNDENPSLWQAIDRADAVITTPSTIYLEAALAGKPTAILDFHNVPPYISSAWSISSADHIGEVIQELAAPPKSRLHYQIFELSEQLYLQSPAADRLVQLITKMIDIASQQRQSHSLLNFPDKILQVPALHEPGQFRFSPVEPYETVDGDESETTSAVERLKAELNQAVHRLATLPRELSEKNEQISQLQFALDESRRRVADVRARLFKLRKILGIGKENQGGDNPENSSEISSEIDT